MIYIYALKDPRGFLRDYRSGAVLDEIQHAPDLLSYLQQEVDENPDPGRFILTGSQHFAMTEAITQTLAGRIAILYLLPPSYDELTRFGNLPSDLWSMVSTAGTLLARGELAAKPVRETNNNGS